MQRAPAPWRWQIDGRSLIIHLPQPHQVLSWASLGGGARRADTIVNHQVTIDDRAATEHPRQYLAGLKTMVGVKPRMVVAMMTGADIRKAGYATARRGDLTVGAWCTAGCSNALRVGDPATAGLMRPGTINLTLVVSQRLSPAAMVEALAMATEARVAAVHDAGILSTRTNRPATGTGTDCIVIASPARGHAHPFCGKHTLLGELIGKAALLSCAKALRWAS
ncbi:MAG: adenosylcobinamide amidohydrolase [Candidatus Binataceae bacterium]